MKIETVSRELHPRQTFRIARARREQVRNVFVRLVGDGCIGFGEAAPNAYYGETAQGVEERLLAASPLLDSLRIRAVADIEQAWEDLREVLAPSRAAQCAVDIALWDFLARREGVSVAEMAWRRPPRPVKTFCTIGLSSPEELAAKVEELAAFPMIKIKSDASADLEPVRMVRARSGARLAVDANCAWGEHDLQQLSDALLELGVEFLEQPVSPGAEARLPQRGRHLPILADESCVTLDDVAAVAEWFDGFNIKLVKCGGITPALKMAKQGRELGLRTMVGCMLESSALIAAGAVIGQATDLADLDGAWLLGDDPFVGWGFAEGVLQPPNGSGLGATPIPELFG